ncbi:hypothetical protein MKZ38_003723 [Zalerion maritima]|uniref:Glutathione synthetase n=1 Tax=Zalerion maritima TaxID=339359 RepID=A0AAD5RYU8_9PEZI|nr:hypothetical protein MKZ38_003723 [Zalerion maritima]
MAPPHDPSSYPPKLSQEELDRLVLASKDWSAANGLCVRPPPALVSSDQDPVGILAVNAPVTLFPSLFPRSCFEQGQSVQRAYNELYAKVSQDEDFLQNIVNDVIEGDEFIANLWKVHQRVKKDGYAHKLSLGLFRSDYMVHQEVTSPPQVKQVEFNTIASSFGGLSAQTSGLHKFLAQSEYSLLENSPGIDVNELPSNPTVAGLAGGMVAAHKLYGQSKSGKPLCIIFLVQTGERNVFDQRHIEYALRSSEVPVFRLEFADFLKYAEVAETATKELLYTLPSNASKVFEVSAVYLRAGYGPGDYPDSSGWEARYQLERSAATKCPSVLTQLAGAKKVQQVLASRDVLSRFVGKDSDKAKKLLDTFTNIFPLDSSTEGLRARKLALDETECQKYVLKPQREGGGNNIYRSDIPPFLKSIPERHWNSYILMELITPPPARNIIMRNGQLEEGGVIGELGVYGACVWKSGTGEVVHNEDVGYLLRTKGDKSEEGGVAAGFGCMDSVLLV